MAQPSIRSREISPTKMPSFGLRSMMNKVSLITSILLFALLSQGCSSSSDGGDSPSPELSVSDAQVDTSDALSSGDSDEEQHDDESESGDDTNSDDQAPTVTMEPFYRVLLDENRPYADGLAHDATSTIPFPKPLLLDIYYPENQSSSRPVFMFIHGGGFTGGTKTKPEIVAMADFFASRGWVFASVDYRTTEELGSIQDLSREDVLTFYHGIAPREWFEFALQGAETPKQFQQAIALYAAQRDVKAALRWMMANADSYRLNSEFVTVGGASAGAIAAIALGISNLEDFRDEIIISDDPTLSTTNLTETYAVKSLVYFWGSNIKLEAFESVYGLNRYDGSDPEIFMAHGTEDMNPGTPFSEAVELQEIYDPLGVYTQLVPLEGAGHGAWDAEVGGKGLFELTFDFLVERQILAIE